MKALTNTRKPPANKIVRKYTQAQWNAIATAHMDQLRDHYEKGRESVRSELAAAKLAQLQAATKLVEEAGRVLSRAGYMIGKLNGDNSR